MAIYCEQELRLGWKTTVAAGVAALCAASSSAMAAECAPRAELTKVLASNFNEKPMGMGLANSGALVVIFASPAGTWTAASVSAEGSACVLGAGDGWTDLAPPVGDMAQSEPKATP
jgi:hypothetical protein